MPSIPIVPHQTPIAPLNTSSLASLHELQTNPKQTQRLTRHLAQAAHQLSSVAGQLIDRGTSYDIERERKRRRAEASGAGQDEEAELRYQEFKGQVEELTRKLDFGVRNVVDDQVWVQEGLAAAMGGLVEEVARVERACRGRKRREGDRDDGGDVDDGGDREDEAQTPPPQSEENASALLIAAREAHSNSWSARTLTERYSQNNTYIEFYRTLHDAHHPGEDVPPVPHHSLWFADEEATSNPTYIPPGTQSQRPRNRPSADEADNTDQGNTATAPAPTDLHPSQSPSSSSDIEVAREKISLKCPITLLPFTDPLTSTKCPHSFDRDAILLMVSRSKTRVPASAPPTDPQQQQQQQQARGRDTKARCVPAVQCPVCLTLLRAEDLRPDPVLVRRMERLRAREQREREEAEEEEEEEAERAGRGRRGEEGSSDDDEEEEEEDDDDDAVASRRRVRVAREEKKESGVAAVEVKGVKGKNREDMEREWKRERESGLRSQSRGVSVVPDTQLEREAEEEEDSESGGSDEDEDEDQDEDDDNDNDNDDV